MGRLIQQLCVASTNREHTSADFARPQSTRFIAIYPIGKDQVDHPRLNGTDSDAERRSCRSPEKAKTGANPRPGSFARIQERRVRQIRESNAGPVCSPNPARLSPDRADRESWTSEVNVSGRCPSVPRHRPESVAIPSRFNFASELTSPA
jgi:hypothetical protein